MSNERAPPAAAASFEALPHDVIELISSRILQDVSPLFDRHDVLLVACTVVPVGSPNTRLLSQLLFSFLSPRLGQEMPNGVTEASSAAQLKAAAKEWGLPVTGSKPVLWQRLLDQVQDSVEQEEEDEKPNLCLVSGATRAELTGYRQQRISQSKAKSVFDMAKGDLAYEWQHVGGSIPGKMFLLADVKREALRRKGSWQKILANRQRMTDWSSEFHARIDKRRGDMRQALLARGHAPPKVEAMLTSSDAGIFIWGNKDTDSLDAAASTVEKLDFARNGPALAAYFHALQTDTWKPSKSMSQYKADHERRHRAANAALPRWVATQPSLEDIRQNARVPRSLLPTLEQLWASHQRAQQLAAS